MNSQILDLESKYAMVVEENENLLLGMHAILEKLRNYDGELYCTLERNIIQVVPFFHS